MAMQYNDPIGGTPSTIGEQIRTDAYYERALRSIRPRQQFQLLADVRTQPRNHGKRITQYLLLPLLSDANVNDQGIDANGATIANGNLYGSSDDIGTVLAQFPTLTENGGDVNRVGFSRITLTADLEFIGFYTEYTAQSEMFDTDVEMVMNKYEEVMQGASEIYEDALQIDLLTGAGTVRYAGDATSISTVIGEGSTPSVVTYDDLVRLEIDLNNAYCPHETEIITGSRKIDTKTISQARPMFISPDLLPTLMAMQDYNGDPAFVHVRQYADAATIMPDERGAICGFRIIANPKAKVHRGSGAPVVNNGGYRATGGNYDVYNMLVVGKGSFTTIGLEGANGDKKMKIKHVKPGSEASYARDVQGQIGFMSVNFYFSTMILRTEWIGNIFTVCRN